MLRGKKSVIVLWMFLLATYLTAGESVSPKPSFVADIPPKSGKLYGVYVDQDTNLMWQDQPYSDIEDGAYRGGYSVGKVGKWKYAVEYCQNLDYAGYIDWRLPSSEELMYVHRKEGEVFQSFRGSDFWSSTPALGNRYYVVFTADAYRYIRRATESNYIRCVRHLDKDELYIKKKYNDIGKVVDYWSILSSSLSVILNFLYTLSFLLSCSFISSVGKPLLSERDRNCSAFLIS